MRFDTLTAASLRRELSARNLARAAVHEIEATYGSVPSILYSGDGSRSHGNFLSASYRRICADAAWTSRLQKVYTANARVPRAADRKRRELDCATSSDALLMNIFCYPGVLNRPALCSLLGVERGLRPEFGVRARIAMHNSEIDRTELDMRLPSVNRPMLFEAKLTETDFQTARVDRLFRYEALTEVFDIDMLPQSTRGYLGYQLVRGVLAAAASSSRFALLADGRRGDMQEMWFRVLRAVHSYHLRSSMVMLTWQEISATLPSTVQAFLDVKYGLRPY